MPCAWSRFARMGREAGAGRSSVLWTHRDRQRSEHRFFQGRDVGYFLSPSLLPGRRSVERRCFASGVRGVGRVAWRSAHTVVVQSPRENRGEPEEIRAATGRRGCRPGPRVGKLLWFSAGPPAFLHRFLACPFPQDLRLTPSLTTGCQTSAARSAVTGDRRRRRSHRPPLRPIEPTSAASTAQFSARRRISSSKSALARSSGEIGGSVLNLRYSSMLESSM